MSDAIRRKLSRRFRQFESLERSSAVHDLIDTLGSPARFDSQQELRSHLTEGALLNITAFASQIIGLPSGEYVVWATPSERTILVPTAAVQGGELLTTEAPRQFDIATQKLLGAWNKVQRVLAEEEQPYGGEGNRGAGFDNNKPGKGHFTKAPSSKPEDPYTFGSDIDRTSLWQAMQRRDIGVSELADMIGVDKSTISRYLREPRDTSGDPGGRDPSLKVARAMATALRADLDDVVPGDSGKERDRKQTRGSGKGGAGSTGRKGHESYNDGGTTSESRLRDLTLDNTFVECGR